MPSVTLCVFAKSHHVVRGLIIQKVLKLLTSTVWVGRVRALRASLSMHGGERLRILSERGERHEAGYLIYLAPSAFGPALSFLYHQGCSYPLYEVCHLFCGYSR